MTSWIIVIDKNYPEHWQIAVEHGFWDMTQDRPIEPNHDVYYWQATKSLLGHVQADTSTYALRLGAGRPWRDAGVRRYRFRFEFHLVSTTPLAQPRWSEVATATGIRQSLQSGVVSTQDPDAETWLKEKF